MISYLAPKVTGAGPGDSHRHLKDSSVHADLHLMDLCMKQSISHFGTRERSSSHRLG